MEYPRNEKKRKTPEIRICACEGFKCLDYPLNPVKTIVLV